MVACEEAWLGMAWRLIRLSACHDGWDEDEERGVGRYSTCCSRVFKQSKAQAKPKERKGNIVVV